MGRIWCNPILIEAVEASNAALVHGQPADPRACFSLMGSWPRLVALCAGIRALSCLARSPKQWFVCGDMPPTLDVFAGDQPAAAHQRWPDQPGASVPETLVPQPMHEAHRARQSRPFFSCDTQNRAVNSEPCRSGRASPRVGRLLPCGDRCSPT